MKSTHKRSQRLMGRPSIADRIVDHVSSEKKLFKLGELELKYLDENELEELIRLHGTPGDYIAFRLGGIAAVKNRNKIWH